MLAPCLGRPQLRFGREGFPQVQILENRSASAKPLRETPPPCGHLRDHLQKKDPTRPPSPGHLPPYHIPGRDPREGYDPKRGRSTWFLEGQSAGYRPSACKRTASPQTRLKH